MLNTYKVTMEYTRGGNVRRVTVKAKNRMEAEVIAEMNNRGYASVDSQMLTVRPRENRFPTMLGN